MVALGGRKVVIEQLGAVGWRLRFGRLGIGNGADRLVKCIALDGDTARFANSFDHGSFGLQLRRSSAGHVENFLFEDCAVKIVSAVAESNLGQLESEPDPIGCDVLEVIEVNAA